MTLKYGTLNFKDVGEFKDFHNLLFKNTDASLEWFSWYLSRISTEHRDEFKTRVYTLRDDDQLVGTWCVEPKDFTLDDGQVIKVGRCFSVGIHPDYRRRNLFVDLSTFAIGQERHVWQQFEYVLGFPQVGRPVIDAHLKSGWDRVQVVDMHSFKPTKFEPLTSLRHVFVIDDFEYFDELRSYRGAFSETNRYRNLRWLNHPDCCYVCLGHGSGYVVLKIYGSTCHILDFGGQTDHVKVLFEATKTLAYRHRWQEVTVWCAANDVHAADVANAGFVPGAANGTSVELLAVQINAQSPLSLSQCHLQMGGEEIY